MNTRESEERKEEILNSKTYARCEIIIPAKEGMNQPYAQIEKTKGASSLEVARLISVLNDCIKTLSKEDPLAYFLSKYMNNKGEVYDQNGRKTGEI